MCIPVVNLVLLIVWACGAGKNRVRTNYARGSLLFLLVWVLVFLTSAVVILAVAGGAFLAYNEGLTQIIPLENFFIS